jgi:hypothetical protein
MMYDLAAEPPEPGGLLELLFILVSKRRQEAEFLKTRVLVEAIRESNVENPKVAEAFKAYVSSVFPYYEDDKTQKDQEAKKVLEAWTSKRAFKVKPLWRMSDNKELKSRLQRGAKIVEEAENARRKRN